MMRCFIFLALICLTTGCSIFPEVKHQPQYHNPFPQLASVAILPFFNLSNEPTVDQIEIALAYQTELQQIPGFEVMPVPVAVHLIEAQNIQINQATDFQKLAQMLGVDAVVVGAVTDFSEYYPPRMGLSVNWYAANPSFHPIPPGYGLPWGRAEEEFIPESLVFDAEFALAREQLKTQTPAIPPPEDKMDAPKPIIQPKPTSPSSTVDESMTPELLPGETNIPYLGQQPPRPNLPDEWPDPRGFIPQAPQQQRPISNPQKRPVMELVRQYSGNNADFTKSLSDYFYFKDDARFGGWQSYLQRKEDFIRFCCYLHVTEMLASRGGASRTRLVWRWPIDRYER